MSSARESRGCVVHAQAEPDQLAPVALDDLNLCGECNDRMIRDLRFVADRWDDAQEALHAGSGGGGSERHAQRTEAPLPINVSVSDALMVVRDNIWSVVLRLVDDLGVRVPADQTTPGLAEWLARTKAVTIAAYPDRAFSRQAYWWIAHAADWLATATHGAETSVEIPDQFCKRPGCKAQLVVVENRKGERVVQCQGDAKHAVQWDTWSKMLKARRPQKRGARPPRLT
ncbi:hypothetical protein [Glutamicibacter sp.]|uniref:hypothetical protein n=1 Tax=Glutamicibacter sp. TaxID=1931995 RepID=UPI0028BD5328|nr:hypothetical protein [Glutamicibacter sp.]